MVNGEADAEQVERPSRSDDGREDGGGSSVADVIMRAREQFADLTGRPPDSVSGFGSEEGGYRLTVEVVELARIPDSTSILGTYEVHVDGQGNLVAYSRVRRYPRNQADDEAY